MLGASSLSEWSPAREAEGTRGGCLGWPPRGDSASPRAGTWLGAAVLQPAGGMASRRRVLLLVEGGGPEGWTAPCLSTGNCPTREGGKAANSSRKSDRRAESGVKSACSGAVRNSGAATYLLCDLRAFCVESLTFSPFICKMGLILVRPSLRCCYEYIR